MTALALEIVSPADGLELVFGAAAPTVVCRGRQANPLPGVPLYFRWYSSLNTTAVRDHYSLNEPALTAADLPFAFAPDIGSHVITFAGSDRAGELAADLRATSRAGVAGGADGATRCRIHVYKARILDLPAQAPGAMLVVAAEAPWDWAGDGYKRHDRLQYRWVFEPSGTAGNRPSKTFTPARSDLTFQSVPAPSRVLFRPALPAEALGFYQVTLFVEAGAAAAAVRAQESRQIELT